MAANIYSYGYGEDATPIRTQAQQEEQKQNGIDKWQDTRIEKNTKTNQEQTVKIDENSLKNAEQDAQIQDIQEKIKVISGGTIVIGDLDAGTW